MPDYREANDNTFENPISLDEMEEEEIEDIPHPRSLGLAHTEWRPNQLASLKFLQENTQARNILLELPTGCHPAGQGVIMYDGSIKLVEHLQVGDRLMGMDSTPRTVQSLIRGHGVIYKVIPNKGEPFFVNDDHILTLVRTNDGTPLAGSLIDVSIKEYIDWNTTNKHLYKLLYVGVEFSVYQKLPLDPYFLGIMLGDGSLPKGIKITTHDAEVASEIYTQAEKFGLSVLKYDKKPANKASDYTISGGMQGGKTNPIMTIFRQLGLDQCRSGDKFIPQMFKAASRQDRLELLAGLMDTDGNYNENGNYDYVTKSEQLAKDIMFLARSLGIFITCHSCTKTCQNNFSGIYSRLCLSGDLSSIPCRIHRKKARQSLRTLRLRTGFTLDKQEDQDFYGFVSDGDHRYILSNFLVTHQSGKSGVATALGSSRNVLVLVNSLALLDQYRDKYGFSIVKGMAEYECVLPARVKEHRAKHGYAPRVSECHLKSMQDCPVADRCPYLLARKKAMAARRMACTYPFAMLSKQVQGRKGIAVWDEGHMSAETLLGLSEMRFSERFRSDFALPPLPLFGFQAHLSPPNRVQLIKWFQEAIKQVAHVPSMLDEDDQTRYRQAASKLQFGLDATQDREMEYYFVCKPGLEQETVMQYGRRVQRTMAGMLLKPLSAARIGARLRDGKSRTILMSATIGDPAPLAQELGVEDYLFATYPHPTPLAYRPIHNLDFERMTYDVLQERPITYRLQAVQIARYLRQYPASWRCVIMCASYDKTAKLKEFLGQQPHIGNRLYTPPQGVSRVQAFLDDPRPGLIVVDTVQTWGHGLDLSGDLARIAIVASVPFGNLTDPFEKVRREFTGNGSKYAWWISYMHVPQACGRVSRGELTRDGEPILNVSALADGSAVGSRARASYPKWFDEAVVNWDKQADYSKEVS